MNLRVLPRFLFGTLVVLLTGSSAPLSPVRAQTTLSVASDVAEEVRAKLSKKYSLDLRDATLLDALFAIRDESGLNFVVGDEVTGTVNASFHDTSAYDILDSLLITRGYGYRIVGSSLAVVPLSSLSDQLPLFETEVIRLQYNTPDDLIGFVESMLSPEGRAHGVESSRSIVVIDYPDHIRSIRRHVDALENAAQSYARSTESPSLADQLTSPNAEGESVNAVRVFPTRYVTATVLGDAIKPLLGKNGLISSVEKENKLVVADSPSNILNIESALLQLDRPRPQVRIWALIYDCSITDLERLGVNWSSGVNGRSIIAATGAVSQQVAIEAMTEPVSAGANGVLRLTSLNRYLSMESIIQALDTAEDSRLLADPNVVVMDHETAEIQIVTEVPYQQLTQGLEGGTIGTTNFREAGVTLSVTPRISDDGTISLVVNPRFSLLNGFTETDNAPIIDRRETTTTVRVANNQTIVLGGLRQRTRISDHSQIPVLGEIPYIGKLFRHRSASTRESELLVFVNSQIVCETCIGTPREQYVNQFLESEAKETPTDPLPFGIEALRGEQEMRAYEMDRHHLFQNHVPTTTDLTSPYCPHQQAPCIRGFQADSELIDVGLSSETID